MLKTEPIVPIHVVQSILPDTIMLGEELMKKQGIPQAQHISLQFGIYKQTIKVLPASNKLGLTMHSRLAQQLAIPLTRGELKLALHYDKTKARLKLGPLLAVLINKENPHDETKPFGSISSFCSELAMACTQHGAFVYFFTPDSLIGNGTLISGWILDGEWRQQILPLAEVIYNRLPSRKAENQPAVQRFIHETARYYNIALFNERFLDKHEVFELLASNEGIASHLPESQLFTQFEQLQHMLHKHPILYVKPIHGSMGRGIYRITMLPNQGFGLERANTSSTLISKFTTLKGLYTSLRPKLKKRKYQLQQGLSLIQIGRRPVDFRALVQKNGSGEWSVTSIVARTAGNEQFVANVAKGGSIGSVMTTLPKTNLLQHIDHEAVFQSLKATAVKIANIIGEQLSEHFAELGIDLAVDVQGKVWLLEVNSKPSKIDNTSMNRSKIRPSVRMLLAYAKHLTGFQEGRRPNGQSKIRNSRSQN